MAASRERQVQFMRSFGRSGDAALIDAVAAMLRREGPDWLTDEQLSEIVSRQVADWRWTVRNNIRNRRIAATREAA